MGVPSALNSSVACGCGARVAGTLMGDVGCGVKVGKLPGKGRLLLMNALSVPSDTSVERKNCPCCSTSIARVPAKSKVICIRARTTVALARISAICVLAISWLAARVS